MPNENTQPFRKGEPRSTDDRELVAGVLGPDEAAEMEELVGEQAEPADRQQGVGKLELTEDEQDAAIRVEQEMTPQQRRQQYYEWADEIGMDEKWVEFKFEFLANGDVVLVGDLNLSHRKITELPPGLVGVRGDFVLQYNEITSLIGFPGEVGGTINLYQNKITSLEGLPNIVNGHLCLSGNNIRSLEYLPKIIEGDLELRNNPVISIPEGLNIKGVIRIKSNQTELIADARAKGYNVLVG